MSEILNDDEAKGNPRAASTRIRSNTATKFSGQIRHDLRRGSQPKYVDDNRSHLNRVLIQPATPGQLRKICAERRALRNIKRSIKSNAAVATVGIITFGAEAAQMFEALSQKDQDRAFKLLSRVIAQKLKTSLHGLVVHLDEATIHAHYVLAAYDRDGHPLSKSTRPQIMSELQDLTARVMQRYCQGIERGHRYGDRLAAGADWSDVINKSVKELHRTLPADLEKKRSELAEAADAVAAAQTRVDEMQGRVTKLEQKESLTEREIKRLKTYQKRLEDRQTELEVMQSASESARVEADRLAALAREDREAEERKAVEIRSKAEAVNVAVAALAEEVGAQTISRQPSGKIRVQNPDKLKRGYPEIAPAVRAAADYVTEMQEAMSRLQDDAKDITAQRIELVQERQELFAAIGAAHELRMRLQAALSRVAKWLKRPDLPQEAQIEVVDLVRDNAALLNPSDDPIDDAGPGL